MKEVRELDDKHDLEEGGVSLRNRRVNRGYNPKYNSKQYVCDQRSFFHTQQDDSASFQDDSGVDQDYQCGKFADKKRLRPQEGFKKHDFGYKNEHGERQLLPQPRKVGRPPKDKSMMTMKKEEIMHKREAQKQRMDALKLEFGTLTN